MSVAIDISSWYSMSRAVEKIHPPTSVFTDKVFKTRRPPQSSETIIFDIKTGGEKLAPFTRHRAEAKVFEIGVGETHAVIAPRIRIKKDLPAEVALLLRSHGAGLFDPRGPSGRINELVADRLREMKWAAERRLQWMCANALSGEIAYTAADLSFTITYPIPTANIITLGAGAQWSDAIDIINANLRPWKTIIGRSGFTADTLLLSPNCCTEFLANADIRALLDLRNVIGLAADYRGTNYIGNMVGLDIYEVDDEYVDESDVRQQYLPDDYVVMVASGANFDVEYGSIIDLKAQANVAMQWFSKTWEVEDPSVLWALVETHPLPIPKNADAIVYVKAS